MICDCATDIDLSVLTIALYCHGCWLLVLIELHCCAARIDARLE